MHEKSGRLSSHKKVAIALPLAVLATVAISVVVFILFTRRSRNARIKRRNGHRASADDSLGIEEHPKGAKPSNAVDPNSNALAEPSIVQPDLQAIYSQEETVSKPATNAMLPIHALPGGGVQEARFKTEPLASTADAPLPAKPSSAGNMSVESATSSNVEQPQPPTKEENISLTSDFVLKHLSKFKFTQPNDPRITARAGDAVSRVNEINEMCGRADLIPGLTKLSFYRFVILCDDSSSMEVNGRFQSLKITLQRVAKFATILQPEGISLRFLNCNYDQGFDDLKTEEAVARVVNRVPISGTTQLGTMLQSKVVQPMIIRKADQGELDKPVIVVIITDGEPVGEPESTLKQTILNCKTHRSVREYGDAAVIFLISQVGNSIQATNFLRQLEEDDEVGKMVFCSLEKLDEKQAEFERRGVDERYVALLIKLFVAALDKQTG